MMHRGHILFSEIFRVRVLYITSSPMQCNVALPIQKSRQYISIDIYIDIHAYSYLLFVESLQFIHILNLGITPGQTE